MTDRTNAKAKLDLHHATARLIQCRCHISRTESQTGRITKLKDTLFNEGCGSCTEIKSNPELLFNSIQFLKNHVQDNCLIFPGHSFGSDVGKTFEQVKKMNIYLGIEDKNQFVDFRMRKNQQSGFNFS